MRGDRVLAAPLAARLAGALGELWGIVPATAREADDLAALTADLRTFSLFEPGKLVVARDTGALADRDAAEALVAALRDALPVDASGELGGAAHAAARRLLQILRLHDVDPAGGPVDRVLAALPDDVLAEDGSKSAAAELRRQLAPLLEAALGAGLRGTGDEEASLVADLLRDGLPPRHHLILVESAVASDHPLVEALARRHAVLDAGSIARVKGGRVTGLDGLVAQLEAETGTHLRADAVAELASRTLRFADARRSGGDAAVDDDSAARFAAEYRKLAAMAGAGGVDRAMVRGNVEDRGEEEVWPIVDALGAGEREQALSKIRRRLAGAEDPLAERLFLFGVLSGFARQVVAVGGALAESGAKRSEGSFESFKSRIQPALARTLADAGLAAIARFHPFRLHKVYLAASRYPAERLAKLPAQTLEAERRLKGDSSDPDAALAAYALALVAPPAGRAKLRGG